ncbi:AEC family transporter [Anaerocaecibacter muris]|uniref:AEC family transporter n=1 Tax=Anaerocaecibacter muris TaxID=2941513 RepID=UPI003F69277D
MGQIYLKATLITLALLAFAVPSFILKKSNMLGDGAKRTLSNILLFVCQPALMISSFSIFSADDYAAIQNVGRVNLLIDFCISAAVAAVSILAVFGFCRLIFIKSKNRSQADVCTFIAMFSNCGFLGIPFVKVFTDNNVLAVMYVALFNVVFIFLCWTLGVYLITHDRKDIKIKKILLNPSIIASVLALILFFVPQINFFMIDGCKDLQIIPQSLATMVAPVSMMLTGAELADMSAKTLFADKNVYVAGALRLIVAPIITFGVATAFGFACKSFINPADAARGYVYLAPVIAMAMAPASVVIALTQYYNRPDPLSAASVITDTLLSVVTVPLVMIAMLEVWRYCF